MAQFPLDLKFCGEMRITQDFGLISSDLGGALTHWDVTGVTLQQFKVQWVTDSRTDYYRVAIFLGSVTEPVDIEIDGFAYQGFFTGDVVSERLGNQYTTTTMFIGSRV